MRTDDGWEQAMLLGVAGSHVNDGGYHEVTSGNALLQPRPTMGYRIALGTTVVAGAMVSSGSSRPPTTHSVAQASEVSGAHAATPSARGEPDRGLGDGEPSCLSPCDHAVI